jgi:hypothetical protein
VLAINPPPHPAIPAVETLIPVVADVLTDNDAPNLKKDATDKEELNIVDPVTDCREPPIFTLLAIETSVVITPTAIEVRTENIPLICVSPDPDKTEPNKFPTTLKPLPNEDALRTERVPPKPVLPDIEVSLPRLVTPKIEAVLPTNWDPRMDKLWPKFTAEAREVIPAMLHTPREDSPFDIAEANDETIPRAKTDEFKEIPLPSLAKDAKEIELPKLDWLRTDMKLKLFAAPSQETPPPTCNAPVEDIQTPVLMLPLTDKNPESLVVSPKQLIEEPIRTNELTEVELPIEAEPVVEMEVPILTPWPTEQPDETTELSPTLKLVPTTPELTDEILLPNDPLNPAETFVPATKPEESDKETISVRPAKTERLPNTPAPLAEDEVTKIDETIDIIDPKLQKDRTDRLLLSLTASETDAHPPTVKSPLIFTAFPVFIISAIDIEEPNLAKLLKDKLLPKHEKSPIEEDPTPSMRFITDRFPANVTTGAFADKVKPSTIIAPNEDTRVPPRLVDPVALREQPPITPCPKLETLEPTLRIWPELSEDPPMTPLPNEETALPILAKEKIDNPLEIAVLPLIAGNEAAPTKVAVLATVRSLPILTEAWTDRLIPTLESFDAERILPTYIAPNVESELPIWVNPLIEFKLPEIKLLPEILSILL